MAVHVLQFRQRLPASSDWTQQEIAEFYRVESALVQAGLKLETDRGVTDEGDPWFVFCRVDTGEVFIHFARIDGEYIIDGAAYDDVARGRDFAALVKEMMSSEVLALSRPRPKASNVFLHPAALLIALVGAAFFHSGEAKAAEVTADHHRTEPRRHGGLLLISSSSGEKAPLGLDAAQQAAVMAGVIIGLQQLQGLTVSIAAAHDLAPPPALEASGVNTDAQAAALTAHLVTAAPAQSVSDAGPPPPVAHLTAAFDAIAFGPPETAPPIAIALTAIAAPPPPSAAETALMLAPLAAASTPLFAAAPAALPDDDAAAVIQALATAGHTAVSLGKLPVLMSDLIGHGQHVSAATPQAAPAEIPAPTAAAPALPAAAADAPAAAQSQAPATPAPPPVATAPATPDAPPPAPAAHAHDPAIDTAVADFMGFVQHYQVMVSGRDLVVYDSDIFGHLPAGTMLDSVTFTFSDGSSISLVGTAAELVEAHHVH